MASIDDIEMDENERRFLSALYGETDGDTAAQRSLYDVGAGLGMDRAEASRTAEGLMSSGLVEIRTLAGGVGLTEAARSVVGASGSARAPGPVFGDEPVVGGDLRDRIEEVAAGLKSAAGGLGFGVDRQNEIMADLRTVHAQLASPSPKTAVLRECFRSILGCLQEADAGDERRSVRQLLGEA